MSPWSVRAPMDQPEMISGPPTQSRLWFGVTSPSLAASIALERSLWINQLHHPCVQKTSVFAYLVMKFAGPAQDNCGRAVCLPSQKARSALVYLTSTDLDSVEEGAPAKRRRISSVGVITDEVQKRLLERLSKGYLGAYLWESGIRGQDIENCLKAERRSGVAVLAISAMQNCLRVYESLGAGHAPALSYESAWEADRAYLGIYSRTSVWASGSARNEPCLPGCVGGSEPEDCGVQVAGYDACVLGYDPTYSTFGSSSCGFAGGSSIESCAPAELGFGIRGYHARRRPSFPILAVSVAEAAKRPSIPQLGVNLPMPPPPLEEYAAVPTTPPMPRPTGVESPPPPPSPDAMSEASDSAVLERGF